MFDKDNKRDIISPKGMKESEILGQVESEYSAGKTAVNEKRNKLKEDLEKYYVAATKKDKVGVHSIYTTIQTLMSVYYNDRTVVKFEGRTSSGQGLAENINRLAEFDYDEMNLDVIDYQWNWDRFFHGVGIKVFDGWDSVTKTPIPKIMSPLSWVPDPLGGFNIDSHRWAGFETETTKAALGKAFVNIELINDKPAFEQRDIREAYTAGRDITTLIGEVEENKKYSIYHHYTRINGEAFLITTANNNTLIIRMIKIKAVFDEEKKDGNKIMFPIALKYYSPLKGDPYGISVPDLLRDKQSAESKLFNLTLISATRNALGDDKLYNPKKIKNIKALQNPTIGGKYIAANVNEGESLSNALLTVPKENPTALPFNVQEQLGGLTQLSTGINSNTLGVGGMQNMTAAESQSIQKNANLRFILGTKVGLWAEKDSWKLWLRSYIYNLSGTDKKVFSVTKVFGSSFFELGREDFITSESLQIRIEASSVIEEERNKYKNDLYGTAPQILADPSTPEIGKLLLKRKMLDFGLFSPDEIAQLTINIDEENAKVDVELMNAGEKPMEIKDGQDSLIYLSIYYSADESDIKWQAILERKEAYLVSAQRAAEQAGKMQAAMGGGDNTANNIASSNASSRQSAAITSEASSPASLQDV